MKQVPNMISTKDLDYLSDMINWNFICSKKINHFINEVQDPEIKQLLESVRNMHTAHAKKLVSILQGGQPS